MFPTPVSHRKVKKSALRLGEFCTLISLSKKKGDLDSVLTYENLDKLSINYFICFDYFLFHNLRKLLNKEQLSCENFYLFCKLFISTKKKHEDIVKFVDKDPLIIKIIAEFFSLIWKVLIKQEENLLVVRYIQDRQTSLKELHVRLEKLKIVEQEFLEQEFEFLLENLNNNIIIIMDLIYTRYCFLSIFSQKGYHDSKAKLYLLFSIFLYDKSLATYLLDILVLVNAYQLAVEHYLKLEK